MDRRTPLDMLKGPVELEWTSGTGICNDRGKENFNASITEKETQEINKNRKTDNNNKKKNVQ